MAGDSEVHAVAGIRLAAAATGVRYADRTDMVLMELAEDATTAAVFTLNAFCAAPVTLAKQHLAAASPRYLLINSGNANAGTGESGMQASVRSCEIVAENAACEAAQVLPFSTGVIGEDLPLSPFENGVPHLLGSLSEDHWSEAANAIMTTDTVPKLCSRKVELSSGTVVVTGMSKGSGMIHPNMATMLAYVATDAKVSQAQLQACLNAAVEPSFNSITVDGDTSTNDACVLVASGASDIVIDDLDSEDGQVFAAAVKDVCMDLARAIVKDGEGATKLIEIAVQGAVTAVDAKSIAFTVAHSPLVKTALFASDPNWGRILAAVGRAPLSQALDLNAIEIWLNDVCIVRDGGRAESYTEAAGQAVMDLSELTIDIRINQGNAESRVLTCDLSYDYVKINAEYRS